MTGFLGELDLRVFLAMKTSIIVGTYNDASHIEATIDSIRLQTNSEWHCLMVDNGSTDNTAEVIQQIISGDSRFEFYQKTNEGPGAGRNFGSKRVQPDCQYLMFLDGDDCLHPEFITRLTDYLDSNPGVGLVACQFDVIDEQGRFVSKGYRTRYKRGFLGLPQQIRDAEPSTPFICLFSATGQGPFAMFRRSVFERTSGYETEFWSHEDSDIFCQMALLSLVHYLPERLYLKRVHDHNLTFDSKADYGKFRDKWDFYLSENQEVNEIIEDAMHYYHGYHAPIRRFKIALIAFGEFISSFDKNKFRWFSECLRIGTVDLLKKQALKTRLDQREKAKLRHHLPLSRTVGSQ